MAAIAGLVDGLQAVLAQIGSARRQLAAAAWHRTAAAYRATLAGSARSEATRLSGLTWQAQQQILEADTLAARAECAIEAIIGRIGGGGRPPTTHVDESPTRSVVNQHGDRYPAAFGDLARSMPPRVRRGGGNAEMMGYVTVDGREYGRLGATRTDPWVEQVRARLIELGLYQYVWLAHHVEMKAVAVMLGSAGARGEARINHAPCGSEPLTGSGCHQVLPDFIPRGRSLTVLGTDAQGQPFRHTYDGRAAR